MTDDVKKLEEAIKSVDFHYGGDLIVRKVIEAAKRDLSRQKSLPEDRKRALDDFNEGCSMTHFGEEGPVTIDWFLDGQTIGTIRSCLSDAGNNQALQAIAAQLQSWLDFNPGEDDKLIIQPPVWPSRGVIKNWIDALGKV